MKYIPVTALDKWEAIEIFCKLVTKATNTVRRKSKAEKNKVPENIIPQSKLDFSKNNNILSVIDQLAGPKPSKYIIEEIFRHKKNKKNDSSKHSKENSLYELARQLNYNEPIRVENNILVAFLNYIDDPQLLSRYKIEPKKIVLNDAQRRFESTQWVIYYFNDFHQGDGLTTGVTKTYLLLNTFGRAEMVAFKAGANEYEPYTGTFEIWSPTNKDNYLLVKMKMKESTETHFHLKLKLTTTDPEKIDLCLGQFSNINRSIYSCSVFAEKVKENLVNIPPPIFVTRKGNPPACKDYIWEYLENKNQNVLGAPSQNITSEFDFLEWKNNQKVKLEKREIILLEKLIRKFPEKAKEMLQQK